MNVRSNETRTTLLRRNYKTYCDNKTREADLRERSICKHDFTGYLNWRKKKRIEDELHKCIQLEQRRIMSNDSRNRAMLAVEKSELDKKLSVKNYKDQYTFEAENIRREHQTQLQKRKQLVQKTKALESQIPTQF